jgi:hypothetical protein
MSEMGLWLLVCTPARRDRRGYVKALDTASALWRGFGEGRNFPLRRAWRGAVRGGRFRMCRWASAPLWRASPDLLSHRPPRRRRARRDIPGRSSGRVRSIPQALGSDNPRASPSTIAELASSIPAASRDEIPQDCLERSFREGLPSSSELNLMAHPVRQRSSVRGESHRHAEQVRVQSNSEPRIRIPCRIDSTEVTRSSRRPVSACDVVDVWIGRPCV